MANEDVKFPWAIFFTALISDILGWLALDLMLFRAITVIVGAILGIWSWTSGAKKTDPLVRYVTTLIIEALPILGDFLPTWTIFVLLTYFKQKYGFTLTGKLSEFRFFKKLIKGTPETA